MTAEPSKDYVIRCLKSADEMLEDAKLLLERSRLKSAADRAYQSMHHAAHAILFDLGVKPPKTHAGLIAMFGKHVVESKLIGSECGRMLNRAFELRQKSDYEVYATLGPEEVEDIVEKAEAFVQRVKSLIPDT